MFDIGIYILALIIGIFIGYIIHILITDKPTKPEFYQQDGNIYIEPKPTRSNLKVAEQEWREGASRNI